MILLWILFSFALLSKAQSCPGLFRPSDTYRSFAELSRYETEGVDFRRRNWDRGSSHTVIAIHGGRIDLWTSEIARTIAGDDLNLYLFEGIKPSGNLILHLTSSRFDEPLGLKMVERSQSVISIHGFPDDTSFTIHVGGADLEFVASVATRLQRGPWQVIHPSPVYPANHPDNIANRSKGVGVQLELSSGLRKLLAKQPRLMAQFASLVRDSLP